jgi:hypothetical protein
MHCFVRYESMHELFNSHDAMPFVAKFLLSSGNCHINCHLNCHIFLSCSSDILMQALGPLGYSGCMLLLLLLLFFPLECCRDVNKMCVCVCVCVYFNSSPFILMAVLLMGMGIAGTATYTRSSDPTQ